MKLMHKYQNYNIFYVISSFNPHTPCNIVLKHTNVNSFDFKKMVVQIMFKNHKLLTDKKYCRVRFLKKYKKRKYLHKNNYILKSNKKQITYSSNTKRNKQS